MNNDIKQRDNGDFDVVYDSLDERFDAIMKKLNDDETERLLLSLNDTVGFSGRGPTALDGDNANAYLDMGFTDDELATLEEVMVLERAVRRDVFKASKILAMGEVFDEQLRESRFATDEEVEWAKSMMGDS